MCPVETFRGLHRHPWICQVVCSKRYPSFVFSYWWLTRPISIKGFCLFVVLWGKMSLDGINPDRISLQMVAIRNRVSEKDQSRKQGKGIIQVGSCDWNCMIIKRKCKRKAENRTVWNTFIMKEWENYKRTVSFFFNYTRPKFCKVTAYESRRSMRQKIIKS